MLRTRSEKRTVALVAAVLLLLCQVAFAAQACAFYVTAAADAAPSCHHAPSDQDSTAPATTARSTCDAPTLASEGVSLPIATVTAFAPIAIAQPLPVLPPRGRADIVAAAQCHPPPVTILHCRFLI